MARVLAIVRGPTPRVAQGPHRRRYFRNTRLHRLFQARKRVWRRAGLTVLSSGTDEAYEAELFAKALIDSDDRLDALVSRDFGDVALAAQSSIFGTRCVRSPRSIVDAPGRKRSSYLTSTQACCAAWAPIVDLRHRAGEPLSALDIYVAEPSRVVTEFGLRDLHSTRLLIVFLGKDDEPGVPDVLRAANPLVCALDHVRLVEGESTDPPLDALLDRCRSSPPQPFGSTVLEAFLRPFIGPDDAQGFHPDRERIINVLEAYKRLWEDGPARGMTDAKRQQLQQARLPFPDLSRQEACDRLLALAEEVASSTDYE